MGQRIYTGDRVSSYSKQKGKRFESDVCKSLSLWVSNGERIDLFVPSHGSGSKATAYRSKGLFESQSGDISPSDPDGFRLTDHWLVECKNYQSLDLSSLVYAHLESTQLKSVPIVSQFFEKADTEASASRKQTMLIAKEFRRDRLVIFKESFVARILEKSYPVVPEFLNIPSVRICGFVICSFDSLLKTKFEHFERITK